MEVAGEFSEPGKSTAAKFTGPGDALRAGIRVIHQELALCPDFTVAENIFLGEEPLPWMEELFPTKAFIILIFCAI